MRLLFINYEYPPIGAGAATATAEMARSAARQGHEVTVLTSAFGECVGWSHDGEVALRRVRSRRQHADQSSILEMASFVIRAAVALPGVVHRSRAQACIVFFSMPCGPLGTLFRLISGGPYVVSLRGGDVPGTEPKLLGMHRRLNFVRRFVLSRAVAVVANSPGLAALSESADPIAVTYIPNGVDLERFRPPAQRPPGPFHFLFVGRLNEQKNVGLLLEAVAELSRSTKLPFRVSIVGEGPLRDSLRQRATSLGLDGLVDWVKWLPREEMPAIYQSAHCVVNPSHYEGMPNVVLEAMACAVPVIVSDVAGNRDVVEEGKSGLIVPHDSREGLMEAMARALREQPEFESLGASARSRVAERYSWDAATSQYVGLLARSTESGMSRN
jgi:glycosyltransferase involved in cell wall biosynthesis